MTQQSSLSWLVIGTLLGAVACEPQSFDRLELPDKPLKLAAADAAAPTTAKNICEQPRKSAGSAAYIVNGTREPTLLPLSPGQKLAVVSLADRWGQSFCSGTLVGARHVVTAQHCTEGSSAGEITVQLSQDGRGIDWSTEVEAIYEHSYADLAVLKLSSDAVAATGASPVAINPESLTSSWVGVRVEAGGFGATSPTGGADGRYFVALPVDQISATTLTVNGEGYHGVCFGDSGGPVMGLVGGSELRLLGALSNGDSSCTGRDNYTRVDAFQSWLTGIVGAIPALGAGNGCGSVTEVGRCEAEGALAVYCDDGQLREESCDSGGEACGYDGSAGGYRCIPVDQDPCQGLDALGSCQGDTMVWCASGELREFDCGACGWACGWASDATGFDCVQRVDESPAPADPCADLDYLGRCDGDVAEWCDGGEFRSVDCGDYGLGCGYINASYGYYCGD